MSLGVPRPRPRLDRDNRAFWTGGGEGKLMICRCGDCGQWLHPPQPVCRACWSENVAPQPVSGRGTIDSFTVNHQPWMPGLAVPFVIARVALEEAPAIYLTTNIVGCPVEDVAVGDAVHVAFEEEDGIFFPLFEKDT
ncbi:Zn-ribbon domain-containing OB-fold protein [Novosphingobium sp. BW1]|uniref:Zn-ribbon domain-containing OB-fold protein n=1 Tax=Novosphingobium sp. BW1 TaxID=2592621 RepID=UPI0011DE7ACC|nr:DNA-binding protein [Novosphingobium sp. BW1]